MDKQVSLKKIGDQGASLEVKGDPLVSANSYSGTSSQDMGNGKCRGKRNDNTSIPDSNDEIKKQIPVPDQLGNPIPSQMAHSHKNSVDYS